MITMMCRPIAWYVFNVGNVQITMMSIIVQLTSHVQQRGDVQAVDSMVTTDVSYIDEQVN